ncbi:MAG: element excision factor XisH family protein [Cyanobacteriota bacterium]|nr:element excision factor XisH family protein [Cyanobacteriota bacterium]
MSARDKFHDSVKIGLEKQRREITDDPLKIRFGEEDKISIDLGAEREREF